MIAGITLSAWVAALLALAAVIGSLRLLRSIHAGNLPVLRGASIIALQCVAMVLLYFALFPPDATRQSGVLTVLTAGAGTGDARGLVIALPEFDGRGGERFPDLASALRRHPDTLELDVRGRGLEPRDRDAAHGLAIRFQPAPLPEGLVQLHLPSPLIAGRQHRLHGRVEGLANGRVELRDPSGALLGDTAPDEQGHFELPLLARASGPVLFALHVLDADASVVEQIPVPVSATTGGATRVLLLAGAPGAELRSLRRWAVDAGLQLDTRLGIGRDLTLGQAIDVDAQTLAETDLLVLDERAWRELGPVGRERMVDAVRAGLGVVLRIGDVLDEDDRASLAELGFDVANIELDDASVVLAGMGAGNTGTPAAGARPLQLTRRPLQVTADAAVALRSEAGDPLAVWRSEGLGRIALWWLEDSYRLGLEADPAVHASLWSGVFATLARAHGPESIDTGTDHGVHRRRILCGLEDDAQVLAPSRGTTRAIDQGGCAAFWPGHTGWHTARTGQQAITFHVRDQGVARGLDAAATRDATLELATRPHPGAAGARTSIPGSPWRFFVGWLLLTALAWWLERRRGRSTSHR